MIEPHARADASPERGTPSILFVSASYPPCAAPGIHRLLRNINHLAGSGWSVSVLTASDPIIPVRDPTLENRIASSVRALKTPRIHILEPLRSVQRLIQRIHLPGRSQHTVRHRAVSGMWHARASLRSILAFPDEANGWIPFAAPAGLWGLSRCPADVIFSSGPEWSNHLVAMILAGFTRIPWVAEFRDAWTENPQQLLGDGLRFDRVERCLEARTLRRASAVITVTRTLRDHLVDRMARLGGRAPVVTIYNSFDISLFRPRATSPRVEGRPIRILHLGNIYADRARTRLIEGLARAVRDLPREALRIEFVGTGGEPLRSEAHGLGVGSWFSFRDFAPEPLADRLLSEADALLVLVGPPERGGVLSVPSKVFRYLAEGKPLIGVVPPGTEVAELVGRVGKGWVADSADPEAIAGMLIRIVSDFSAGSVPLPSAEQVLEYSAQRQLDRFSTLLAEVRARRRAAEPA